MDLGCWSEAHPPRASDLTCVAPLCVWLFRPVPGGQSARNLKSMIEGAHSAVSVIYCVQADINIGHLRTTDGSALSG